MIKKFLLGLFVSFVGFLGFSNASWFGQGLVGEYNNNPQNILVFSTVFSDGNFSTDYISTYRDIFYISDRFFFFWGREGKINGYYGEGTNDGTYGGSIKTYFVCDLITGNFSSFTNCQSFDYSGEYVSAFNNILYNLNNNDLIFYGNATRSTYSDAQVPFIAFNVSDYGKVLLISYTHDCPYAGTDYSVPCSWRTLNVDYRGSWQYSDFPEVYVGKSPNLKPIEGVSSSITGTYIYKNCTVEVATINFEETYGYNMSYCSGGNVVDGYYQYNTLKEYCSLIDTYFNSNYGDILYTGTNPNACLNVDSIWKVGTGKELSSVDWSNIIPSTVNNSGQYEEQNPTSFVVGLIDNLTSRYYFPETGDFGLGYLPWYIIAGLMGVIFFRFISH